MLIKSMGDRKVNRLQLKANNYADIQKATFLIEDAFRTASFPGLPKNGLIVIRRLDLGKIFIKDHTAALSNLIDQRFLELTPQVISIGQEEWPDASVVWFADPVAPYVLLAHLLSKGITPASWYWSVVVPDWMADSDTNTALVSLLLSASKSANALLSVTAIMNHLVENRTINKLLDYVSFKTAEKLLQNLNIDISEFKAHSVEQRSIEQKILLTRQWSDTLRQWLPRLKKDDSRSLLLALSAAINYNYVTAEFTVRQILDISTEKEHGEQCFNDFDYQDLDDSHAVDKGMETPLLKDMTRVKKETAGDNDGIKQSIRYSEPEAMPSYRSIKKQVRSENKDVDEHGRSLFKERSLLKGKQPTPVPQERDQKIQNPLGALSMYAGLPMLINVLERLRIHETLLDFPMLTALDLPNRIFWAFVTSLGIDPDDRVCHWLTARHKLPASKPDCEFVAPFFWLNLLLSKNQAERLVLRRSTDKKEKHVLFDPRGEIVLAIWQGAEPGAVSELMKGRKITLLPSVQGTDDLQYIISTYLFAACCFLRRYAKKSLKNFIAKKGYIAVTKTHLDISYSMQSIDIDIRKAGLDIDPGWVPWLGRVVQFYYLENEMSDPGLTVSISTVEH